MRRKASQGKPMTVPSYKGKEDNVKRMKINRDANLLS